MAYLRANSLPMEVAQRVIRHVRHQNSRQREDRAVLEQLPRQIRAEIFLYLYEDVVRSVELFNGVGGAFPSAFELDSQLDGAHFRTSSGLLFERQ